MTKCVLYTGIYNPEQVAISVQKRTVTIANKEEFQQALRNHDDENVYYAGIITPIPTEKSVDTDGRIKTSTFCRLSDAGRRYKKIYGGVMGQTLLEEPDYYSNGDYADPTGFARDLIYKCFTGTDIEERELDLLRLFVNTSRSDVEKLRNDQLRSDLMEACNERLKKLQVLITGINTGSIVIPTEMLETYLKKEYPGFAYFAFDIYPYLSFGDLKPFSITVNEPKSYEQYVAVIAGTNDLLGLEYEPMSEEQYNKEYELALRDYSFSDDGAVVKTGPALTNRIIMDLVESVRKLCLNNEKKF